MTKPTLKEIRVGAKTGGRVQIVKFNLQNTFEFTCEQTYGIPENWTDEQIDAFRTDCFNDLKAMIDQKAQDEQDELLASSDWYTP